MRRRRLLVICALSALTFFTGLGRAAISESDEAFYAEAGREMVERGDWLTPHFNYEIRFQKPILYYWIVAASYTVAGVSEAAARFGSALSGLGLALLTFTIARRMYGESAASTAGAIVATSFGYFAMAHLSLPDLPLTFFVTLATWYGFRALDDPASRRPILVAAVAAALGMLTKGPLGLLLPALVVVPIAWLERRMRAFRPSRLALAGVVFAAIAVPWYAAMTWTHGAEYLRGFLIGDNVERFATTRFNNPRAPWYYLEVIAGGLLPWTPFAALLVVPAWRWIRRQRPLAAEERRLIAWALLPLVFFTLSIGKQARYILPILPPLAILIARAIDVRAGAGWIASRVRALRTAAVGSSLVIVLAGVMLWRIRPLLGSSTNTSAVTAAAIVIAVLGLAAVAASAFARPRIIIPALASLSAMTLAALQYGVFSTPRAEPVELIAASIAQERQANEPIGAYHAVVRNLVFYTRVRQADLYEAGQVRAFLRSQERVLCVLLSRDAADFERDGERFRRLAEFRYFDTATMKARTVLAFDPARDLTSVVVVTNK